MSAEPADRRAATANGELAERPSEAVVNGERAGRRSGAAVSGGAKGRFDELARAVLARPARLGGVRLVAVDGRAGSGKTTFAARLARALRAEGSTVAELHTDDFLDGWAKLLAWQPRLREWVFEPFRAGRAGAFRRYDWGAERLEDTWSALEVPQTLLVEGVGSASAAMRPDLTLGVFVEAPRALRFTRGLERDGEGLRPQWERWMADEDVHFGGDPTAGAVELRVNGAPSVEHDPQIEYIIVTSG
ncbi:hypothetical protein KZZ52_06045 [Dactylosporangium sp. AC04546]|uniref:uridine kinase family protein n=1 Tax=Dactylosporangium sp. AC04546 TaxID=2862460 RepID=UPI002E7BBCAB|nr:hypothetical protein [Dactylosporangium sp. AC04546]WVK84961.1 hypothetical protein KZZ52_06045 [Dactylosporangium sp. AC04546]